MKYEPANYLACFEKAAELGSIEAHETLAELATRMNNRKVALAHHKVLASCGYSRESLDELTAGYKEGYVTKDDLALSLRSYHSSREEFTSTERAQFSLLLAGMSADGNMVPSNQFM